MYKIFLVSLSIIFLSSLSFAARPLTTDDAGVVSIAKYEVEVGYDNCKVEDCSFRMHSSAIDIKHGLTEMMDLSISLPFQIEPAQNEKIGAVILGVKFAIIKDIVAFTLSNALGTSQYFVNSILSKDFEFINCNINIGYIATGKYEQKGKLTYAVSSVYPIEKIGFMTEIFNDGDYLYWLTGTIYNLINNLFIDLAYSRSFQNINEKITGGLHYEF